MTLIDRFLPVWDAGERHEIDVPADGEAVFRAAKAVTPAEVPLMVSLFALRALPGRLVGKHGLEPAGNLPILQGMIRGGFSVLGEVEGEEIVLGVVGKFWQLTPSILPMDDVAAFEQAEGGGYAKAALNFLVVPAGRGCTLRTETRVSLPDPASRRRFLLYWAAIRPGSALICRAWLRAARRRVLSAS